MTGDQEPIESDPLIRYRRLAVEARENARRATTAEMRADCLTIAESYDRLAESTEFLNNLKGSSANPKSATHS
jgi:hypothetical protein